MADYENNPIVRKLRELESEFRIKSISTRNKTFPEVTSNDPAERAQDLKRVMYHGVGVTLKTERGTVKQTVMLPNFQAAGYGSGLRLATEIAKLLALTRLKRQTAI